MFPTLELAEHGKERASISFAVAGQTGALCCGDHSPWFEIVTLDGNENAIFFGDPPSAEYTSQSEVVTSPNGRLAYIWMYGKRARPSETKRPEGGIAVFDTRSGKLIDFEPVDSLVSSVAVRADGQVVATSTDTHILIYRVDPRFVAD